MALEAAAGGAATADLEEAAAGGAGMRVVTATLARARPFSSASCACARFLHTQSLNATSLSAHPAAKAATGSVNGPVGRGGEEETR